MAMSPSQEATATLTLQLRFFLLFIRRPFIPFKKLLNMISDLALETSLKSWTFHAAAAAALILYPVIVSVLRCRRIEGLEVKYKATSRESLAKMTDNEAFDVVNNMAELEFPTIYEKALQFALFRVLLH